MLYNQQGLAHDGEACYIYYIFDRPAHPGKVLVSVHTSRLNRTSVSAKFAESVMQGVAALSRTLELGELKQYRFFSPLFHRNALVTPETVSATSPSSFMFAASSDAPFADDETWEGVRDPRTSGGLRRYLDVADVVCNDFALEARIRENLDQTAY